MNDTHNCWYNDRASCEGAVTEYQLPDRTTGYYCAAHGPVVMARNEQMRAIREVHALTRAYGEERVTRHSYSDVGEAVTIRGLYRPDLGRAVRYANGDRETTITLR